MRGSQITFHGDDQDLAALFAEWFAKEELVIAQTLGPLGQDIVSGRTPAFAMNQLPKPGDLSSPAWVIAPADRPLVFDTVEMRDGSGSKQRVALENRFVVGIRFGGSTGATELQPTVLSSSAGDKDSAELFKRLRQSVTRRAKPVSACWLLPGAYGKLESGWRLPRGQFQGPATDLPRPA